MSLNIIFMGSPAFAVPTLEALHRSSHNVTAVFSQPPRPAGRRGLKEVITPVAEMAQNLGLPLYTPKTLKGDSGRDLLKSLNPDIIVVVAYGLLLPQAVLDIPPLGCYNGHASLLPRWRGAAPIQRSIMAGDKETGITIMKMEAGLDTGAMALKSTQPIEANITSGELHNLLATKTAALMLEALDLLEQEQLTLTEQPAEGVTYAEKISKDETRLDFTNSAIHNHRKICGLAPSPGAWCEMVLDGTKQRVKLFKSSLNQSDFKGKNLPIRCGDNEYIYIYELQKAGSKIMSAEAFLNGYQLAEIF